MSDENFSAIIREIIDHLKDGNWHTLYSLHYRFRLTPIEILRGIKFLNALKIIQRKDNEISLILENMNDEVIKELSIILRKKFSIRAKDLNNTFSSNINKIGINELYSPQLEKLSKTLFNKKI